MNELCRLSDQSERYAACDDVGGAGAAVKILVANKFAPRFGYKCAPGAFA